MRGLIFKTCCGGYKRPPSHSLQTLIRGCHAASVSRCSLSLCVFLPLLCVVFKLIFKWAPHRGGAPACAVPSDSSFLSLSPFLPPSASLFLSSAKRYTKEVKKGHRLIGAQGRVGPWRLSQHLWSLKASVGSSTGPNICAPLVLFIVFILPFSPHRARQASTEQGAAGMPIMRCGNCDWVWFKWFQMLLRRHQAEKKTAGSLFHWYAQKRPWFLKGNGKDEKIPQKKWPNVKTLDVLDLLIIAYYLKLGLDNLFYPHGYGKNRQNSLTHKHWAIISHYKWKDLCGWKLFTYCCTDKIGKRHTGNKKKISHGITHKVHYREPFIIIIMINIFNIIISTLYYKTTNYTFANCCSYMAVYPARRTGLSTLFYIHEFADGRHWLLTLWQRPSHPIPMAHFAPFCLHFSGLNLCMIFR